jgi:hypothetical protein
LPPPVVVAKSAAAQHPARTADELAQDILAAATECAPRIVIANTAGAVTGAFELAVGGLVWEHPEPSGIASEQWPYALATLIGDADPFAALAFSPAGPTDLTSCNACAVS